MLWRGSTRRCKSAQHPCMSWLNKSLQVGAKSMLLTWPAWPGVLLSGRRVKYGRDCKWPGIQLHHVKGKRNTVAEADGPALCYDIRMRAKYGRGLIISGTDNEAMATSLVGEDTLENPVSDLKHRDRKLSTSAKYPGHWPVFGSRL